MLAAHYYDALTRHLITTHNLSKISTAKLYLCTAAWELGVGVVVLPEQLRNTVVPVAH